MATTSTTYTIRNDFHNTSARVRADRDGRINARQVRRVRSILCGMADCKCGGSLGERGPQDVEIEPTGAGDVILTPKGD